MDRESCPSCGNDLGIQRRQDLDYDDENYIRYYYQCGRCGVLYYLLYKVHTEYSGTIISDEGLE